MKKRRLLDPDDMPQWVAKLCRTTNPTVIAGVNDDDCAVFSPAHPLVIATLDFLNASPIALQLGVATMRDLGRLLVAANVSDLLGSGAAPSWLIVGITMSPDSTRGQYRALMRGVAEEAKRIGITVVGGDSKLGKHLAIVACAIGVANSPQQLFLKNAAQPGDVVWVSGPIGSTAAAVAGWSGKLTPRWRKWARSTLIRPQLPLRKSRFVSSRELGHGGTDISDGFGCDLDDLCSASGVGTVIRASAIPFREQVAEVAVLNQVPPWTFAFASGGDFQFIVTTPESSESQMRAAGFINVGSITRGRKRILAFDNGKFMVLPTIGHRDRRGLTFAEEVKKITQDLAAQYQRMYDNRH